MNTVAESLYPAYSVRTNALSDLGALGAQTGLLWNGQLFLSGLLSLLGMYLLFYRSDWPSSVGIRRKAAGLIYVLPPIGTILVSLFPENYVLAVHAFAALMTFVLGGVSAVYAYRLTQPPFRYFSFLLGAISLVSILLLGDQALGFGLAERLVVYPFVIWGVAFGSYLLAFSAQQASGQGQ